MNRASTRSGAELASSRGAGRSAWLLAGTAGLGAACMYLLDPQALQGEGKQARQGRQRWAPATRAVASAAGAGFLTWGLRRGGVVGAVLGVAGAALIARGASNRPLFALLGRGAAPEQGISVEKNLYVDAPLEAVYGFWTDVENFPLIMSRVRKVERMQDGRSSWTVTGPAGVPVEWVSEMVAQSPGRYIEWRSVAGSPVKQKGSIRFRKEGAGTRLDIRLAYVPSAGAVGHAVATVFGADPKSEMDADLMRMKTTLETGRAPHDAAATPRDASPGNTTPSGSGGGQLENAP
jgi:uncharacterized membrane protein